MTESFWSFVDKYSSISLEAKKEWERIILKKELKKGEIFQKEGKVPKNLAFIQKGLLSYYYIDETGSLVIKKFFKENSLVTSTSALLSRSKSIFTIEAIENTCLYVFSFDELKYLMDKYKDLMCFYISYLENNWVIEKEVFEIDYKYKNAKQRYLEFLDSDPELTIRLKQHHIASYLGITPTQLSRIKTEL